MKATLALAASLAALLTTAGAAQAADAKPAPAKRSCFWAHSVSGFAASDERTVNLRVGVKDIYQLEMLGPCHDVDWANAIGIKSRGSDHICSGLDADIISPTTLGPRRCQVKSVRKLTTEEIAALPKRGRP